MVFWDARLRGFVHYCLWWFWSSGINSDGVCLGGVFLWQISSFERCGFLFEFQRFSLSVRHDEWVHCVFGNWSWHGILSPDFGFIRIGFV